MLIYIYRRLTCWCQTKPKLCPPLPFFYILKPTINDPTAGSLFTRRNYSSDRPGRWWLVYIAFTFIKSSRLTVISGRWGLWSKSSEYYLSGWEINLRVNWRTSSAIGNFIFFPWKVPPETNGSLFGLQQVLSLDLGWDLDEHWHVFWISYEKMPLAPLCKDT